MSDRPTPLQNRVSPAGDFLAVPDRGTIMGNRGGRLHDAFRLGAKRWVSKQWISCKLAFKDRHREVMGSGYTELFFLDEATAAAAGHRPCFECRRADATEFATLFAAMLRREKPIRAPEIDAILHTERTGRPWQTPADALPTGAMFRRLDRFWLVFGGEALLWEPGGYCACLPIPEGEVVDVMTPRSVTRLMQAGYRPGIHPSALDVLAS